MIATHSYLKVLVILRYKKYMNKLYVPTSIIQDLIRQKQYYSNANRNKYN